MNLNFLVSGSNCSSCTPILICSFVLPPDLVTLLPVILCSCGLAVLTSISLILPFKSLAIKSTGPVQPQFLNTS